MVKYDMIDLSDEGLYCVREIPSDQIIMASDKPNIAKKFIDAFNRGAGFDGWTPEFFIQNDIVV